MPIWLIAVGIRTLLAAVERKDLLFMIYGVYNDQPR